MDCFYIFLDNHGPSKPDRSSGDHYETLKGSSVKSYSVGKEVLINSIYLRRDRAENVSVSSAPLTSRNSRNGAYNHALSIAKHYGAKLFVLNVVELWQYPCVCFAPVEGYEQFRRHLFDNGQRKLLELENNLAVKDIQSHCVVREGMAPDVILELAESEQIDLIVMGTHGRRGFDRLMLGSVTERVMRKSLCPVLAVHRPSHASGTSGKEEDPVHVDRILFCTDFSENSERALHDAFFLAAEYSSELVLAHVLEDIPNLATTRRSYSNSD